MNFVLRRAALITLGLLFVPHFASAQLGQTDYSKATTSTLKIRDNLTLLQIHTPQDLNNILVLTGPDGILLVDHPELASAPIIKKELDSLGGSTSTMQPGKNSVRFLINTHWHYDHVGGNEIYGPDAVIIAQENVRKRLMTAQKPSWSPTAIGPYPENAWPRITYENSLTIHFDREDIELDHYAPGHTDGDSVAYFAHANVVHVADIYDGKGSLAAGIDMLGISKSLTAVRDRINDDTIIITGHSEKPSNRAELTQYVSLLDATIDQVRASIAAGQSEKEVIAKGLPAIWQPWFAPAAVPPSHDFMQRIYRSLNHTMPQDQ